MATLRIESLEEEIGYVVRGDIIFGRQDDSGDVIFGGRTIIKAEEMDNHYLLLNSRGATQGVTDTDDEGRKEALSRLHTMTKEYCERVKNRCSNYEHVEILDESQVAQTQ